MAHTPGPWEAKWSKYRDGEYIVQTKHPSNRVIASFDDDGDGAGEQSIADAHLSAAAPDLLDALKAAHGALMYYEWYANPKSGWASPENETLRGAVEAAIAKATGSQA